MSLFEMIIWTLIMLVTTNLVAWGMIWRQVRRCARTLKKIDNSRKCGFNIDKYMKYLEEEETKWKEVEK